MRPLNVELSKTNVLCCLVFIDFISPAAASTWTVSDIDTGIEIIRSHQDENRVEILPVLLFQTVRLNRSKTSIVNVLRICLLFIL